MYQANYSPAAHAEKFHQGDRAAAAPARNIYEDTFEAKLDFLRRASVELSDCTVQTDIHQPYAAGMFGETHVVVRPSWNNKSVRLELNKLTHNQAQAVMQFLQESTS